MIRSLSASLIACAVVAPLSVFAQTCEPGRDSHEADLFAIRSLSLAMGRAGAIVQDPVWTVRAGVEAMWLPHIDDNTATPTTCRPGKEPENVNALAGVARARIAIALPAHLTFEGTWIPPVTLKGMQGNLLGVAVSGARAVSATTTLSARVHATFGRVTGPFTCPGSALENATSECFHGLESHDRLNPNVAGGDVAIGWAPAVSRYAWYAGAGVSSLRPRFHVNFTNAAGVLDTTLVTVNMTRVPLFGGVSRTFGARWRASVEAYRTTNDGATVRVSADRILHSGR